MTVTRGFTEEADKLLEFLESGIFDALQKQYLKSFIFAVYLDPQDPNNIVEAYTFNFNYYTPPGSSAAIPIMSLGDDLMKLSLDQNHREDADPVAEAVRQGKAPTLGEMLVKNLIQATTQMDPLPRRRYATFKLFYHDHTPEDYEPPHFRAGDVEKDRWFFATHDKRETPEKCSVGRLETGWHGVDVRIASVSAYLPSTEDNNAAFAGTCGPLAKGAPSLTPAEEATTRAQEIELQARDAEKRRVIWDAEDGLTDMDADGEQDPDYDPGDRSSRKGNKFAVEISEPLGIRNADGNIVSMLPAEPNMAVEKGIAPKSPSLPPSDLEESITTPTQSQVDTMMLMDNLAAGQTDPAEDSEMLDLESQIVPQGSYVQDSIESFQSRISISPPEQMSVDVEPAREVLDRGLDCECGSQTDDDQCWCDSCGRWYHVWYHSAKDKRLPAKFLCFDCRVRADQNWDLIVVHDLYPSMIAKFKDLALFRRAIKIAEIHEPESPSEFCKLLGVEADVSGQLFKRLEGEGFIEQVPIEIDDIGLLDTRSRAAKAKAKGKQPKRKNLQKKSYRFVRASKRCTAYLDYFNPDVDVEKRILGFPLELPKSAPPTPILCDLQVESQTQNETQFFTDRVLRDATDKDLKRKLNSADDRTKRGKKVKISVVAGVDLGD
ncbi:hypothetical protein GLOTRDRAFT_103922 [Gloeophyllum trabeum ATCC 11539]|uniref:HORMA domain-containing protein n=1 Tax=Gloeophyllum trabeum (strain ATCC 11539 / FP-39264 / Madison 617) TaxID=670483 RepID=S7RX82_GLOTA|nr:uncharacterized protein GLOTRDRAFT_103922 [Gloeophyllum trabeum ATCC 11539]EPQ57954.1 hypothetical protein GLOTRDRAFT_103922 [Gloeophyllum trabeum ATCC 11539]